MNPALYTSIKILLLCASILLFLISYFHANEARKAERRLKVKLPILVNTGLSFHIFASSLLFTAALLALILGL